ncbi:conserved Plasmodium protein, unknown function [Plasmodium gallinaceum]|uniref:Uncharacterized protein n=1 Tax=Plasmodium gallinaceum TaxID=5849 RepID=A0A1J1GNM0_PLAGA|nr:conserved Plasmodium protein, unknown function [Plasmodium gallinaceum]CRG93916.1 conserved Plasmodium protein, unknown function [Plasmodium gallinaceum]
MEMHENSKNNSSKKGWIEEIKGKYSNIMSSGSKDTTYLSTLDNKTNKDVNDNLDTIKEEKKKKIKVTNNMKEEKNEIKKKKKDKRKNSSFVDDANSREKKQIFFEIYKKYYFIEMTEYHKSRENCTINFLNFLETLFEKMIEVLKHGSDNINNLNKFFKEFLKNDIAYFKNVSYGNSKINNLTQSFLNIPNEDNLSNQQININKKNESKVNDSRTNIIKEGVSDNNPFNYNLKEINNDMDNIEKRNYFLKYDNIQKDTNEDEEKNIYKRENNNVEYLDNLNKQNSHFLNRNSSRNSINKINEIVDNIIDINSDKSNLNYNVIDEWIKYGYMNYIKIISSMKVSCDLIDNKIYQKKLTLLKETYIKEQENLIEVFKKKKNDFLKQLDTCKNYWKYFENSYSNSEKIRSDGIKDSKKIKCSWLCQRKYLKNVKDLLVIQNEYLEIIYKCVKTFFQLMEWKKDTIRDILGSYILLYKSFLNFYLNNMNILYESVLQEKNIEKSHVDNLNSVTMMEDDIIKPVIGFHFDENCNSIPILNNAINLIRKSVVFYNSQINVKSILCLFSSKIKGYLTSVGIFNKCVEGIIVISWDKFIHFFNNVEDTSPQWSYYLGDIEFKMVKNKKYQKKLSKEKNKKNVDTNEKKSDTNNIVKDNNEELRNEDNNKHTSPKNNDDDIRVKSMKSELSDDITTNYNNTNENSDMEIQMKEKKKTLLINGWSFTFKCSTEHLTKVCFELLRNHLYSEYFQDENSFSHFTNIICNGEIQNDMLFGDEVANYYNINSEEKYVNTQNIFKYKSYLEKGLGKNLEKDDKSLSFTDGDINLKDDIIYLEKKSLEENNPNNYDNKKETILIKNIKKRKEENKNKGNYKGYNGDYNNEDDNADEEENEDDEDNEDEDDEDEDDEDEDDENEDDENEDDENENDENEDDENEDDENEDDDEKDNEGNKNDEEKNDWIIGDEEKDHNEIR